MTEFDHIVVGAGSSGAALAGRLADAGRSVLLIEAGGRASSLWFSIPAALRYVWADPKYTWSYETEPEAGLDGRKLFVPRGRVLGGSSSINGMICNRGAQADYDDWAASGLTGWSYADVLPYFKRSESNWRGASDWHGGSGPVPVAKNPGTAGHVDRVFAAAKGIGHSVTSDFCGEEPEGWGLPDLNTRNGRRVSSADAYLSSKPSNLHIALHTRALRILLEGKRAVGIEYLSRGSVRQAFAADGVALCGGTFNTPHLLMLSGIGPAAQLEEAGLAVELDVPGVGRDLEDQPGVRFSVPALEKASLNARFRVDQVLSSAVQWALAGKGLLTAPPVMGLGIVRTKPGIDRPDMRMIVSAPIDSRTWFPGWRKPVLPAIGIGTSLCYPRSRGSLTLNSRDPMAPPRISFGLYREPEDLAEMRRGYRILLDLLAQPSLAAIVDGTRWDGGLRHDSEIDAFLRAESHSTFHPVGSCRMGATEEAPVDAEFRLRGIEGLRIVDASIFPTQIGGNPNLPAIMFGERAADLMLGKPLISNPL